MHGLLFACHCFQHQSWRHSRKPARRFEILRAKIRSSTTLRESKTTNILSSAANSRFCARCVEFLLHSFSICSSSLNSLAGWQSEAHEGPRRLRRVCRAWRDHQSRQTPRFSPHRSRSCSGRPFEGLESEGTLNSSQFRLLSAIKKFPRRFPQFLSLSLPSLLPPFLILILILILISRPI